MLGSDIFLQNFYRFTELYSGFNFSNAIYFPNIQRLIVPNDDTYAEQCYPLSVVRADIVHPGFDICSSFGLFSRIIIVVDFYIIL